MGIKNLTNWPWNWYCFNIPEFNFQLFVAYCFICFSVGKKQMVHFGSVAQEQKHSKALFTRVRTNICTDMNLHGFTLRLHGIGGTGRIFERPSVQV